MGKLTHTHKTKTVIIKIRFKVGLQCMSGTSWIYTKSGSIDSLDCKE